jgi:hypothetical protein
MVGDPVGPDGLNDFQREGLDLRRKVDRTFCDPLDQDFEPESIDEAHWWVQPKWVKHVSVIVGLPAGLIWTYEVQSADTSFLGSPAMFICFGAIFFVAVLQLVFIFRAYWRMDI